ncbi:MAG: hypothetical protein IPJ98_28355 [Bryobacterales bacterium]|nr:hypothetical protein [Bryobacterales bacterium]
MTVQTLALATLPFDEFLSYMPSWQEAATFLASVAYGVIVYSFSYRYTRFFPQEQESPRRKGVFMLPRRNGFHWSPAHLIFLSVVFRARAEVVGVTLLVAMFLDAAGRARGVRRRLRGTGILRICQRQRQCRHAFRGEVPAGCAPAGSIAVTA